MYDILQLNDMLLPELQDVAEGLKIENFKKLTKQDLVYKILDKQAVIGGPKKAAAPGDDGEKPKRKRFIKATTSNSTEEAVVEDTSVPAAIETAAEAPKKHLTLKKGAPKKEAPQKEAPQKRARKKQEDEQPSETGNEAPVTSSKEPTDGN